MNCVKVVKMASRKILFIHQNFHMQEIIQACLSVFAGWEVQVCNSTLEGVQKAILFQPDAIIMEFSVGEIEGLRFIKQLSTQPATQGIPVVILAYPGRWGDLEQSWFQQYHLPVVRLNALDIAMLHVETANVLGWDLDSGLKSRNREQGRGNREQENYFM
jgi:CheY-like chemotaxis protein